MVLRSLLLAAPLLGALAVQRLGVQDGTKNLSFALSPDEQAKCYMPHVEADTAHGTGSVPQGELGSIALLTRTHAHREVHRAADYCARVNGDLDLSQKYDEIFGHGGNRNCASHLWVHFILSRAADCYSHSEIEGLFNQFCPVAGSPIPSGGGTLWSFNLPRVNSGGPATGMARHCCLPCACDVADSVHVDTKTVSDNTGAAKTYEFLVIGNPCANDPPVCTSETQTGCIPEDAPHVVCQNSNLNGAELSDGGYVIVGMFFDHDGGHADHDFDTYIFEGDGASLADGCKMRAENDYSGGVGSCFHRMGLLNPVP